MKATRIFILSIALFASPFSVYADGKNYLVVVTQADGIFDANKKVNKLFPSEVVSVIRYDKKSVLVQRVGEQPSFEVKTQEENEQAKMPTWISISKTARQTDFVKVNSWLGEFEYNGCVASCDSGTIYEFSSNGSFAATYAPGNVPESEYSKWAGHLYRFGKILWARPNMYKPKFDPDAVFYLQDDGRLCNSVVCFGAL